MASGILTTVDFSSDDQSLVFAEQDGGATVIDGAALSTYTIKRLDLDSGTVEALVQLEQGVPLRHLELSGDGSFVLYTLQRGETRQIWWLDTRSRNTGPLTNTLNASAGFWR